MEQNLNRAVESMISAKPDYTGEIIAIIRSPISPSVMRERLEDYHEKDIAEVLPALTSAERKKLYRILEPDMLSNILERVEGAEANTYLIEMDLRKAACYRLKEDCGLDYEPTQIVVASGAKHSVYIALMTLCNPGDEVVIAAPYWVRYSEMVKQAGAIPVIVAATEEADFKITAEQLDAAITDKTKVFMLNSPSNPTGMVYTKAELEAIAEVCCRHNIYVIADEIYCNLVYDNNEFVSFASLGEDVKERTILVNGVSKSYAMTGWRLGWAMGPKELMRHICKIHQFGIMSAPTTAQFAGIEAIRTGEDDIERMREQYDLRRRYLLGSGLHGLMNYPFRTALLSYLAGTSGAEDFRDAMETIRENYPSPAFYGAMNFLSTHDTPRLLTVLGCEQTPADRDVRAHYRLSPAERERGTALLKLAALVLYAFPGSPTVYYGDEAGMEGFEDPFNRRTYPWGHEDTALLDWFRTLGRLRAERESLQSGGITYPLAAGRVLCFARRAGDEVSLCAVNAGAESASVDLPWAAPLAHDALSGQSFLAEGGRLHITLAPYDALLLTE